MSRNTPHPAVETYTSLKPSYDGFAAKLETLLRDILANNDIKYHVVESRAKAVKSFAEKISRPGKHYSDPLQDIKDLCGCRVILYYQDDVPKVADLLRVEFEISEENLTRQPDELEVDRFGYISAHYIIGLNKSRSELVEWKSFSKYHAEVQVRTVVQHAWSAVSHTIQYKREATIPSKIQRRLHRIAGLFELADEEFVALRKQKEDALTQAKTEIEKGQTVAVTAASLPEFLATWTNASVLSAEAEEAGFTLVEDKEPFISLIYDLCLRAGIDDLAALEKQMAHSSKTYLTELMIDSRKESSTWTVSPSFLIALKLISSFPNKIDESFLVARGFGSSIAKRVLSIGTDLAQKDKHPRKPTVRKSTKS